MSNLPLAVLHDFFSIRGGGERVALTLAQHWQAHLVFGFRTQDSYDTEEFDPLPCHNLHAQTSLPGLQTLRLAHAFRHRTPFLRQFDKVIYSGDLAPLAAIQRDHGNLFYCHTPPRMAYDQFDHFLLRLPRWQRPLLHLLAATLRRRYQQALPHMNILVANSENVRQRIRHYWQRDAVVVHPPCDTRRFQWIEQGDYYLSTARLEPLKRVDTLVAAFKLMPDKKLVVASGGSQFHQLQRLADGAPNIHFTHWIDNHTMAQWIGRAIATLYAPHAEDFGMSPLESMAAGKPVIAVAEGGLLETVRHQQTGWLMPPRWDIPQLMEAVAWMTPQRALSLRNACQVQAAAFDVNIFLHKMALLLEQLP